MTTDSVETVILGAGFTGLLCARELLRAGREVLVVERGDLVADADRLPYSRRIATLPTTEPTHEAAPGTRDYPWMYGFGAGGSSLLWACVAPRLLPADFELRSRYGVGVDWPIGYADLEPYLEEAELLLRVAGEPDAVVPRRRPFPAPAPAPSPVDRLVGPLLEPWGVLAQARPPDTDAGYPAPPGGYDRGFTLMGMLREDPFCEPGFTLRPRTVAISLRRAGGRVQSVECVDERGEHSRIDARTIVLAANGIENAALLLRSGLDGPHVGRWLFDHGHASLELRVKRDAGHGPAPTRDSGISYAWADGPWRGERASMAVIPYNPGLQVRELIAEELADGGRGLSVRRRLSERYGRSLVMYVTGEDLPRAERRVELSPRRGPLGLPLNRVSYPPDSEYFERGLRAVVAGLEERLASLGARMVRRSHGAQGRHLLGTCRMGDDGVVDENQRHHELPNLYVAGGSAFPAYGALHPTLTIAALGLRLGRHLVRDGRA